MKPEYKTTELWAVGVAAALWIIDKWVGTNVLDTLADGQTLTEAKVQVAAIAASLREATGSDSGLLIYAAMAVYFGRKVEKVVAIWKGARAE
ncbi:MAG: hypothetical protein KA768_08175 [Desulfobulbus sp.]|nr:hypothetical protein [Desulfobulbus sp.]